MDIKKVCHITPLYRPYFAGHGIYLEKKVFPVFHKKGIHNMVITASYDNLPESECINDVEIYRVKLKRNCKKWNLLFSIKTVQLLYRYRNSYDIIHMHGYWDVYGILTIFSMLFGKKMILHMTLIGYDDPVAIAKSYKMMNIRFKLLSRVDNFISISTPMSNSYRKTSLPPNRLIQIPQGVDTILFSPVSSKEEKYHIKNKLGILNKEKIVIFVGAIIKRKGIDTLIEEWRKVDQIIPDAHLILIGPDSFDGFDAEVGPLKEFCEKMKKIIFDEKLHVDLIGRSDEVYNYLKIADIFVLPSINEGCPNVVGEAMSTGLPIILTEMGGIAYDLIIDEQEGFIVHNREQLADRIMCLLNDPIKAKQMGKMARERALKLFDIEKICDKYIQLYNMQLK